LFHFNDFIDADKVSTALETETRANRVSRWQDNSVRISQQITPQVVAIQRDPS